MHVGADTSIEKLAHVVISTGFDLTCLGPADILELLKEGKDLRAFRSAVATFAKRRLVRQAIASAIPPEKRKAARRR
jgi:hypothetical protein